MMKLFSRATERKHRSRKFVSQWTSRVEGGQLEAKSLAAPVIYNIPQGTAGRLRVANAWINDAGGIVVNMNSDTSSAVMYTEDVNDFGALQMRTDASSSSSWVDNDDPPAPAAPVGNTVVTANTAQSVGIVCPGFIPNLAGGLTAFAAGNRNFILADDSSSASGPVTLVENYVVTYSPASNTLTGEAGGALTAFNSPSTAIAVAGNPGGLNNLAINGTLLTIPSSGTVTAGGVTTTWVASSTVVSVEVDTPFATLPANAGANPPVGVAWGVNYAASLAFNARSTPGHGDIAQLTTHYDASF